MTAMLASEKGSKSDQRKLRRLVLPQNCVENVNEDSFKATAETEVPILGGGLQSARCIRR